MSYNEPPYGSPPPPPPPEGGYGYQGYGGAPQQTSVMAIISLVTGIIGVLCCGWFVFSIAAVVLGILAKKEIDQGLKAGRGLAVAGLVLGVIGLVLGALTTALFFLGDFSTFTYGDF